MTSRGNGSATAQRLRRDVLGVLLGVCLGYAACVLVYPHAKGGVQSNGVQQPTMAAPLKVQVDLVSSLPIAAETKRAEESPSLSKRNSALIAKTMQAESRLQATFRSCLSAKCFDEKMLEVDRVGFLAIPSSGGAQVARSLQAFKIDAPIQLLHSTNVPPYGYGKNHGWSRIIRFVRPVIPHAYSLVRAGVPFQSAAQYSGVFGDQVRQLVRWHCRLSHVAAHTRMLTVFLTDVTSRPRVELERMVSFVGGEFSLARTAGAASRDSLIEALLAELGREATDDLQTIPEYLLEAGVAAVREELDATQELSAWPCRRLSELDAALPLAPALLAPNCSAPSVRCTIPLDKRGGR